MSIDDDDDLQGMRAAGLVVRAALDAMSAAVAPGVTTAALDAIAERVMREHGARSAPQLVYDFPGVTCISINEEMVHGIPSAKRRLAEGDLVKLDVTFEKNGYMADAAVTVPVGHASPKALALAACAERAFERALREVKPGRRVREVGRAIDREVRKAGFSVVRMLQGHGIGRTIHEDPMVPNWDDPAGDAVLTAGLVITVEPIIAMGNGEAYESSDGWTIRSMDGSWTAHHEHTLVVRRDTPLLLTAAA